MRLQLQNLSLRWRVVRPRVWILQIRWGQIITWDILSVVLHYMAWTGPDLSDTCPVCTTSAKFCTSGLFQHGTNISVVPFLNFIPWSPLQKFWQTPNVASWLEFPVDNSVAGEFWSCNGVCKSFHLYQFKKQNDLLETQNSRVLGLLKNLYGCVKIR